MNIHNFSTKQLLTALSTLYDLDRHEPLNFAIEYAQTRKALGYGFGEFKAIYTAYVTQGGRCNG